MRKVKRRSDCPIGYALDIFGDKWSLLIIRDIMFKGKSTYGEFLTAGEKIATNILADKLQILESSGILSKAESGTKSKYIYSLTKKGVDLMPALLEIISWSAKYDSRTGADPDFVQHARRDKEGLMQQLRKSLVKQD